MKRFVGRLPIRFLVPGLLGLMAILVALIELASIDTAVHRAVAMGTEAAFRTRLEAMQVTLASLHEVGRKDLLERELAAQTRTNNFLFSTVADRDDVVLGASHPELVGQRVASAVDRLGPGNAEDVAALRQRLMATGRVHVVVSRDGKYFFGVAPYPTGYYLMARDFAADVRPHMRLALTVLGVDVVVLFFVCALAGISLHLLLVRRVGRLVAAAGRLGAGELGARTGIGGRDEVAQVGEAFDQMAGKIQESTEALQQAMARERELRLTAEALSRVKDQFLSSVSHELRTPLVAMIGWTDMIADGTIKPGETQVALDAVRRNGAGMIRLIDDLLDLSHVIRGAITLTCRTTDLARLVPTAMAVWQPAAETKGLRIEVSIETLPLPALVDPERFQQIVWSLLSNAVKFTPAGGGIDVRLRAEGDQALLIVADDGIGMEPDFLPHVFDHFLQADGSLARRYGGLGIGLALAQHLVELHGGVIEAASAGRGKGSTFTVRVPLAPAVASVKDEPGPPDQPR